MILAAALFLSCTLVLYGDAIPNWPAPATWSPSRSAGTLTTQDVTNPLPFVGLAPCRILDTRGNGFSGAYGPPSLAAGVHRDFTLSGQCGIPSGSGAVSLNVTVTNTKGAGFIKIYPQGGSAPVVSTLNYIAGQTIANAAVVPLGSGGGVSVVAGVSGTDLIVDTNGYYASSASNPGNTFMVINSGGTTVPAILGQTNSSSLNATGVKGIATTGVTNGVWGDNLSTSDGATGVFGFAEGTTGITTGIWGRTRSSSVAARGVLGEALATSGVTYGVLGLYFGDALSSVGSAGVKGVAGAVNLGGNDLGMAGVRGDGSVYGVGGISDAGIGVIGWKIAGELVVADGRLGYTAGATNYGVYADTGTIGCNGCTKQFVDPHPTDPTKTIHYVSLEGPEAGTYFRGTARTLDGQAVIEVPDHFRWVTQEEGMTVQLTPVGELAMMAVISQDLSRIVVRSSKDVAFHYLVQGIRPAHHDFRPVIDGGEYAPQSAKDKMKGSWPAWTKQRLVENGTYNADGTVNMETAERVGWTKMWAEREERARAAAAKSAAERLRD
jgi:hypothetical protein